MLLPVVSDHEKDSTEPPGRWIVGLSAGMPLLEALEMIFRQRFQAVMHFLPLAADRPEENIEFVHKLRVSCRRLTAVLDVLAEGFPEAPRQSVLELVEEVRSIAGKARDLDVRRTFLESLLRLASVEDAAVIELLCEKTASRRGRIQHKLRRRLEKLAVDLGEAGAELISALRGAGGTAGAARDSFGVTGCRILTNELASMCGLAAPSDLASMATLHQLRIAGKHLRYAFEVFMPVLPDSFRDEYYPQLEEVQKLLGEIHDADEAIGAFRRTKKKWKGWRGSKKWARRGLAGFRWPEVRAGLDAVLLACAQQADHARTEFLDYWPGFSGDSFRRPVAEMLTAPIQEAARGNGQDHHPGSIEHDEHLLPH